MKYLLDSHVLLWLIAEPHKVGPKTIEQLRGSSVEAFVSLASLWELGLKYNKGKLPLNTEQITNGISALGAQFLGIKLEHILAFNEVRVEHSDPFDLMLCAQARSEKMVLVTANSKLLALFPGSIDARI